MNIFVGIYTHSPSKKLSLIIYDLSVSPSAINIPKNLQTNKARQKQYTHSIPSVSPLVNLTYHR